MLGQGTVKLIESSESELINAAKAGDIGAFEKLIASSEHKMLAVAAGMAASTDEAEDIYQEAMINAFKAIKNFRLESQFNTWLYRIVVNTALSHHRKLKNKMAKLLSSDRSVYEDQPDESAQERYAAKGNPEHSLINQQLNVAITQAMTVLSVQERLAFVLCHQQELKIDEAAQLMSATSGTIKSYLFRAREKLRGELQTFMRS